MSEQKGGGKFAMGIVDALLGKDQQKADDRLPDFKRLETPKGIFSTPGHLPTTEAALAQSENLRVAQQRILELEEEIERLRRENEKLIAAGQTLNRRIDETSSKLESTVRRLEEEKDSREDEKRVLSESINAKDRELGRVSGKVEELEIRLNTDLKKIRVRERELENRLEIMKMESSAVVRNKDEIILDLKRRLDQLNSDIENQRSRESISSEKLEKEQEKTRRAVKAMRLALSLLEDEEVSQSPLKRAK